MRIIIIGIGDIGRKLAEMLSRRGGSELVLIDSDEKRCEKLAAEMDALVLHGDGTDPALLRKAQVAEAGALVATTDSDPINTVIAMLGHRFGVDKLIVKLNDVGLRAACQEIGVTKIIAPKISAAAEIVSALHGLDRLDFSLAIQGGLRLVELGAGKAAGQRLAELDIPEGILIIAIQRGERVHVPRGNTRLADDDILMVLVEDDSALEKIKAILTPP